MSQITVLDKGWVELIDVMGSDARIVAAARISYDHETKGEEADKKLIHYLLKHNHSSPFEQPHMTFRMKAPIFVLRQLMRHRMANWNEISLRYTEIPDENDFYIPLEWRSQDKVNKQSSVGFIEDRSHYGATSVYIDGCKSAIKDYEYLLEVGVAREQARMVLPVSVYSKVMFTIDLRNLLNMLAQRNHAGAQWETREYAKAIKGLVSPYFPWTFEALENIYQLRSDSTSPVKENLSS